MPSTDASRRAVAAAIVGVAGVPSSAEAASAEEERDYTYGSWYTLPLAPYSRRRTLLSEVVPGQVWALDQIFGTFYVHVPIRSTVMAVQGGLFVYAPVAATPECIRLVKGLESTHGPVKYILLPSKAVEHKVLTPPFARAFPDASLFVAPGQFSVPVDLPLSALGFPSYQVVDPSKLETLPWSSDCDTAALDIGTFAEISVFHRRSRSLVLTDSVVRVSEDPPPLLFDSEYKKALAYHAHDDDSAVSLDSQEVRRRGWARIALFANFFNPGAISDQKVAVPETGGSRPWRWQPGWEASFARLRNEGRPFVAPIIRELILKQQPEAAKAYVAQLASWNFERVVPAHFDCPIDLSPKELLKVFSFLDEGADSLGYCAEDVAFLSDLQKSAIPNGRPVPATPPCGYAPRT